MESNCGVCLENREESEYEILPCSHKLCNICLPKLLKSECPFCRNPFKKDKKEPEILQDVSIYHANIDILEQRTYDRLQRRQRRRERRRERRQQQNRDRPGTTRQTHDTPIFVFTFIEEDDNNENENEIITNKKKKKRHKNLKKSERWNHLRNQRSIINY